MTCVQLLRRGVERGHAANHPGLLNHDADSIELEFDNGVLITIDPSRFKVAAIEENENGTVLKTRNGQKSRSFSQSAETAFEAPRHHNYCVPLLTHNALGEKR